jgi:hypothetical protein
MRTRVVPRAWVSGRPAASPLLARSGRRLRFFWAFDSISLAVAVTFARAAIRREFPPSRVMKLRIAPQWRTARSGMRAVHPALQVCLAWRLRADPVVCVLVLCLQPPSLFWLLALTPFQSASLANVAGELGSLPFWP